MPLLLLPVEHVQQQRQGECLAACAAMILNYMGAAVAYNRLVKQLETVANTGTPSFKIRKLTPLGVNVQYQRGTIDRLRHHLQRNQPPIVFVQTKDLLYRTMILRMRL